MRRTAESDVYLIRPWIVSIASGGQEPRVVGSALHSAMKVRFSILRDYLEWKLLTKNKERMATLQ